MRKKLMKSLEISLAGRRVFVTYHPAVRFEKGGLFQQDKICWYPRNLPEVNRNPKVTR